MADAVIAVLQGPDVVFELESSPVSIGRGEQNDICLPSSRSISTNHARIELHSDSNAELVDLGSMNGTFVNSDRVLDSRHKLQSADAIRFGYDRTTYLFYFAGDSQLARQPQATSSVSGARPRDVAACSATPNLSSDQSSSRAGKPDRAERLRQARARRQSGGTPVSVSYIGASGKETRGLREQGAPLTSRQAPGSKGKRVPGASGSSEDRAIEHRASGASGSSEDRAIEHRASGASGSSEDRAIEHRASGASGGSEDRAIEHRASGASGGSEDRAIEHRASGASGSSEDRAIEHRASGASGGSEDRAIEHRASGASGSSEDRAIEHRASGASGSSEDRAIEHRASGASGGSEDRAIEHRASGASGGSEDRAIGQIAGGSSGRVDVHQVRADQTQPVGSVAQAQSGSHALAYSLTAQDSFGAPVREQAKQHVAKVRLGDQNATNTNLRTEQSTRAPPVAQSDSTVQVARAPFAHHGAQDGDLEPATRVHDTKGALGDGGQASYGVPAPAPADARTVAGRADVNSNAVQPYTGSIGPPRVPHTSADHAPHRGSDHGDSDKLRTETARSAVKNGYDAPTHRPGTNHIASTAQAPRTAEPVAAAWPVARQRAHDSRPASPRPHRSVDAPKAELAGRIRSAEDQLMAIQSAADAVRTSVRTAGHDTRSGSDAPRADEWRMHQLVATAEAEAEVADEDSRRAQEVAQRLAFALSQETAAFRAFRSRIACKQMVRVLMGARRRHDLAGAMSQLRRAADHRGLAMAKAQQAAVEGVGRRAVGLLRHQVGAGADGPAGQSQTSSPELHAEVLRRRLEAKSLREQVAQLQAKLSQQSADFGLSRVRGEGAPPFALPVPVPAYANRAQLRWAGPAAREHAAMQIPSADEAESLAALNYRLLGALSQVASGKGDSRRATASLLLAEEVAAGRLREEALATEVCRLRWHMGLGPRAVESSRGPFPASGSKHDSDSGSCASSDEDDNDDDSDDQHDEDSEGSSGSETDSM